MAVSKCIRIELRTGEKLIAYPIPKHSGYSVSRCGRLFSCWKRIGFAKPYAMSDVWHEIKPESGRLGHRRVSIKNEDGSRRRVGVSALVLETFVGPCPPGMEACHFPDRDPSNNSICNLRWDTHKSNLADRITHKTLPLGDRHHQTKIPDAKIQEVLRLASSGLSQTEVARMFNVTAARISQIVLKGGR